MPKKSIEENIDNEFEKIEKSEIEEPVFKNKTEESIEESTEKEVALNDIQLTIRRVDAGGLYVVDSKGNGINLATPKRYKNKVLKAGDIILVSKSEL